jgi:hypothetical protein
LLIRRLAYFCALPITLSACGTKSDPGPAIGIAECDEYLRVAHACLDDATKAARPDLQKEIDANRALWTKAHAAGGLAKDSLATTCRVSTRALERHPACKK